MARTSALAATSPHLRRPRTPASSFARRPSTSTRWCAILWHGWAAREPEGARAPRIEPYGCEGAVVQVVSPTPITFATTHRSTAVLAAAHNDSLAELTSQQPDGSARWYGSRRLRCRWSGAVDRTRPRRD